MFAGPSTAGVVGTVALDFHGRSRPWIFSFLLTHLGALLAEGADPSSGRLPTVSLVEDPPQRLRWQAHLEFTHNHDVGDLTWDKIATSLPRSEKLRSLVLAGIPHSMRPQLWMRLSGALQKKKNSELSYREIVKNSSNDETIAAKQVSRSGTGAFRNFGWSCRQVVCLGL